LELPEGLGTLNRLEMLTLSRNLFSSIPRAFEQLVSLRVQNPSALPKATFERDLLSLYFGPLKQSRIL
jgi:hypothetical protein